MCEMSYTDKSTFGQYNCFYGIQQICGNGLKLDSWMGYSLQFWFRSVSLPSSICQEGAEGHLGYLVLICFTDVSELKPSTLGSVTMIFTNQMNTFLFNQYKWYSLSFLHSFRYGNIHRFSLNTGRWTRKWHACLMSEVMLLFPDIETAKSRNPAELLSTFELHSGALPTQLWSEHLCNTLHVASQVSK